MKLTMTICLLLLLLEVSSQVVWADEPGWRFIKEKGGIRSFSQSVPDTGIKKYRAVATIDAPVEVLLEILLDVPAYVKWMPDCLEATILKEFHNGLERGNFYIHLVWDAQWPARNRDLVIESTSSRDREKGVCVIKLKKSDACSFAPIKGMVRIPEFESEFRLEYLSGKRTRVTFTTFVNPGGGVPAGLASAHTSIVPYGTLKGMAKMAGLPEYQNKVAAGLFVKPFL